MATTVTLAAHSLIASTWCKVWNFPLNHGIYGTKSTQAPLDLWVDHFLVIIHALTAMARLTPCYPSWSMYALFISQTTSGQHHKAHRGLPPIHSSDWKESVILEQIVVSVYLLFCLYTIFMFYFPSYPGYDMNFEL